MIWLNEFLNHFKDTKQTKFERLPVLRPLSASYDCLKRLADGECKNKASDGLIVTGRAFAVGYLTK